MKNSVKLSDLKNDDMLLVGEHVLSKEDYITDMDEYKGKRVYTTTQYKASLDAKDILEDAIAREADDMYDDWEDSIWSDITDEDISEIQAILDRIINKNSSSNISYVAVDEVIIDITKEGI